MSENKETSCELETFELYVLSGNYPLFASLAILPLVSKAPFSLVVIAESGEPTIMLTLSVLAHSKKTPPVVKRNFLFLLFHSRRISPTTTRTHLYHTHEHSTRSTKTDSLIMYLSTKFTVLAFAVLVMSIVSSAPVGTSDLGIIGLECSAIDLYNGGCQTGPNEGETTINLHL